MLKDLSTLSASELLVARAVDKVLLFKLTVPLSPKVIPMSAGVWYVELPATEVKMVFTRFCCMAVRLGSPMRGGAVGVELDDEDDDEDEDDE